MGARRCVVLAAAAALAVLGHGRPLAAVPVDATIGIDPSGLAGVDAGGRVLLYTPNPLETGSSVSHWDTSAFPNLLMEPASSSDLPFQQVDLTLFQLRDIGWPAGSATVTLRFQDGAGQGFNDPSLGAARRAAMQRAAAVWANRLRSPVEINVAVDFDSLTCDDGSGILAQAGAQFLFESFPGAPVSSTWYPGALAESLSGQNLSLQDVANPDAGDLALTFNRRIDDACLGAGSRFYYGLDGNVPSGQISFVNVALHEMAHGLGFQSFVNEATGAYFEGRPDVFSRFTFDNDRGQTWNQMNAGQRRASAVNAGRVAWSGSQVRQQAPNFLRPGPALTIQSPASIAGVYQVGTAAFGPQLSAPGVSGELALAVDGSAAPSLLCGAVANAGAVAGRIAVVDRGTCNFTVKVKNAQIAGARAVIVVNNVAGAPPGMGGSDASITIPSVSITRAAGERIQQTLAQTSRPGTLTFAAAASSVAEDAGAAVVTVRRSNGTDGTVSVGYATSGGTATPGVDYVPASGTVTFGDGQGGSRSFEVEVLDDLITEGDETVVLELSSPTGGAVLGNPATAVLEIADDDVNPAGVLAFAEPAYRVNEGGGTATITVERSGGTLGAVGVDYATGGGSAAAGEDYVAATGTVAFGDGDGGVKTFEVQVLDDDEEESIETVGLALSNPTGGALLGTPSSAMLDVVDNEPCRPTATRLCLDEGRFRVEVAWRDFSDVTGPGRVEPLASDDSGLFWFFTRDNLEMLVKVLDGCGFNDRFWVFAAATTDVEYALRVTDTVTGESKEYVNPLGVASPAITDTDAFATCDAGTEGARPADAGLWAPSGGSRGTAPLAVASEVAKADCQAGATALCLSQGRFQVEIAWRDFSGSTGSGQVEPLASDDSGLFWFFSRNNLELLVKVLDGCGINDRFWVFAAATTDVEYTLRVTDTDTGQVQEYANPLGVASPAITDTDAFATCPGTE